jgi:predicted transcriptional regulator of viral defense system
MDPRWRQLHDTAMRQEGHVTTRQVEATGLTRPALHYQVTSGLLARATHGVYRFTTFPPSDREREAVVLLWAGADAAVPVALSHETALRRYDLTDVFPEKLHLTVPTRFRKRPAPDVALHRADLDPEDVRHEGLLTYTTPARTILDLVATSFPLEPLREAYRHALDLGLLRARTLTDDAERVRAYLAKAPGRSQTLRERLAQLVEAT